MLTDLRQLEIHQGRYKKLSTLQANTQENQYGFFETILLCANQWPKLMPYHEARLKRSLEHAYIDHNLEICQRTVALELARFRRQIAIASQLHNQEPIILRYQLLFKYDEKYFENTITFRSVLPLPRDLELCCVKSDFPENNLGRKQTSRNHYESAWTSQAASFDNNINDYYDLLLVDESGYLIEGSKTNIFIYRDKQILTPALTEKGVAGTCRAYFIDACLKQEISISITSIKFSDLLETDMIFVTNAIIGVRRVDAIFGLHKKRTKYTLNSHSDEQKNLLKFIDTINTNFAV